MAAGNELLRLTLADAARRVKSRDVSPVDLVDATLGRIAEVDGRLAAFIRVFEDEARQVAKAAEMMVLAGHDLARFTTAISCPVGLCRHAALYRTLPCTAFGSSSCWWYQPCLHFAHRVRVLRIVSG